MCSNFLRDDIREITKADGITDAALLDGDLQFLEEFLYSNLTQVRKCKLRISSLCIYNSILLFRSFR